MTPRAASMAADHQDGAGHAFDVGNGPLPYAGAHDALVVKLAAPDDSDARVVLTRTAP